METLDLVVIVEGMETKEAMETEVIMDAQVAREAPDRKVKMDIIVEILGREETKEVMETLRQEEQIIMEV